MQIAAVCPIHVPASITFDFVSVLLMIGPRDTTMTAALLVIRIHVSDPHGGTAPALPDHRIAPFGPRGSMVSGMHLSMYKVTLSSSAIVKISGSLLLDVRV